MWFRLPLSILFISLFHRWKYCDLKSLFQPIELELQVPQEINSLSRRLDSYLASEYTNISRTLISDLCEQGKVLVNDKPERKSYKLSGGEKIVVLYEEKRTQISEINPEKIPLDVLYEDFSILAINKPNGMVVHPAVGSPNGTFVNALLYHLGGQAADTLLTSSIKPTIEGDILEETIDDYKYLRPGIVHRLDKGTTGVLLAGKNPIAVEKLSKLFATRKIYKMYVAICVGFPGDVTIIEPIGRSKINRQMMCVDESESGKIAISHTKTIAFDGKLSLVLVKIDTGRTHQIRVHLQYRHTPILGDPIYGSGAWNKQYSKSHFLQRPLLHAYEMQFNHPFRRKKIHLYAPLPSDMMDIISDICANNIIEKKIPDETIIEYEKRLLHLPEDIFDHVLLNYDQEELTTLYHQKKQQLHQLSRQSNILTPSSSGYVPQERITYEQGNDWMISELIDDPTK